MTCVRYLREEGERVALVLLGAVNYYTGELLDIDAITAAGHAAGAVVGWDLAHAAGNVAAAAARLGRRLGGLVLLQVPQRRARVAGRRVRARAAPRRPRPAQVRRLVVDRSGAPGSRWRPTVTPVDTADSWQVSNPPILAMAPVLVSLRDVRPDRDARAARQERAAHRLPRVAARRDVRRAAGRERDHAPRPGSGAAPSSPCASAAATWPADRAAAARVRRVSRTPAGPT